ncbi:hypothetical protein ACWD6I_14710 [Streptomyces sp. NPDC002454]|uniref:hypothetical protein n=1 Tax=unclassified Streptomyces TaxID=2593676 RepID=UPI00332349D6
MSRHEFQPGRLIAGLVLLTAGVLYLVDAADDGDLPWWTLAPLVVAGLGLAALVGVVTMLVRSNHRTRPAARERQGAGDTENSPPGE